MINKNKRTVLIATLGKATIEAVKFPAVRDFPMLAQTCSDPALFGQYVAQIFSQIK